MWVAGVDGCRTGWFCALRETEGGKLSFQLVGSAAGLVQLRHEPAIVAIDIPIGLPDRGSRACDVEARRKLGQPRGRSVFPATIRPALAARTREEASKITELRDGRRVSAQAFAIVPKIREVDELLAERAEARLRLREVHPEVSFAAWNGDSPLVPGKRTATGRSARLTLVEAWLGKGVLAAARGGRSQGAVGDDDILDAIAALWTATRMAAGTALTLPSDPPRDARGLSMEIVY
jgi:predicted RNase H-like nuclease